MCCSGSQNAFITIFGSQSQFKSTEVHNVKETIRWSIETIKIWKSSGIDISEIEIALLFQRLCSLYWYHFKFATIKNNFHIESDDSRQSAPFTITTIHIWPYQFFSTFSSAMQIGSVRAIRRIQIEFVNFDDLFESPFRPDRNYQRVRNAVITAKRYAMHTFRFRFPLSPRFSHTFSPIRNQFAQTITVTYLTCFRVVELSCVWCTVYGPSFIKRAPHSLL